VFIVFAPPQRVIPAKAGTQRPQRRQDDFSAAQNPSALYELGPRFRGDDTLFCEATLILPLMCLRCAACAHARAITILEREMLEVIH
jgi:hypothetical protein